MDGADKEALFPPPLGNGLLLGPCLLLDRDCFTQTSYCPETKRRLGDHEHPDTVHTPGKAVMPVTTPFTQVQVEMRARLAVGAGSSSGRGPSLKGLTRKVSIQPEDTGAKLHS